MNISEDEYFKLYANCILVSGSKENAVIDLHRGRYLSLPHSISEIICVDLKNKSIKEYSLINKEDWNIVEQYLNYLIENDFGFYTDCPNQFLPLDLSYDSPNIIESAILRIQEFGEINYQSLIQNLFDLGCKTFQIIVTDKVDYSEIASLLAMFKTSIAVMVQVVFAKDYYSDEQYREIGKDKRIVIKCYDSSTEVAIYREQGKIEKKYDNVFLVKDQSVFKINSKQEYGLDSFNMGLSFFTEAVNYNVGLNKKVFIDWNGDVKNYITHERVYGNIKNDSLIEIVSSDLFQEKWEINNDKLEKCKDCQFRYICFSNSDIQLKDGKYYKVDSCNFYPSENKWVENSY